MQQVGAVLAGALLTAACDAGPRVPFKLSSDSGTAPAPPQAKKPAEAQAITYPDAVDQPHVEGIPLPLGSVRTLLVHDLDADGQRDAIALVHDATRRLRLVFSLRDAQAFRPATDLAGFMLPNDASCTLEKSSLRSMSADKALLSLDFRCGDDRVRQPTSFHVLALEATPRVVMSLGQRALQAGESTLTLAFDSTDVDEDGHSDLTVSVVEAPALRIPFRDRASGLARDLAEPEGVLSTAAKLAEGELAKAPAAADARVQDVLAGFQALCREAEAPRVELSGEPGIPCGKTPSRVKLLQTSTLARAKQRLLGDALASYRAALGAGLPRRGRAHDKLRAALQKLSTPSAKILRTAPLPAQPSLPYHHQPLARFVDEDTLLLGAGSQARTLRVGTGEETQVSVPADALLRDPSGHFAVIGVEHTCAGYAARVAKVPEGEAAYAGREHVAALLVLPSGSPPASCRTPPRDAQGHELQILGWAPQGLVCAHAGQVWITPVSSEGEALGAPFLLAADAQRPAPLTGGAGSRDGAYYVEGLPVGVVLHGPNAQSISLLAPPGFAEVAGDTEDVAVSPSGQRVAVVAHGTVYILGR
jgi:hypothetical protein